MAATAEKQLFRVINVALALELYKMGIVIDVDTSLEAKMKPSIASLVCILLYYIIRSKWF
jgi:hypothetical protein